MWFLYLARCKDSSIYTGITTCPKRREKEHNGDNIRGAKSLRFKRPVEIVYTEQYNTQSEARIREAAIKKWTRFRKLKLITNSIVSNEKI
jgi:putative endonuclease